MAGTVPNKYDDPYWVDLAASTEDKLGLPKGLLVSVLTKGEKSNNNQVSEAGAKTPFQIIPETRKAAIKQYGIDPYLSPENAAEVAGMLLKDSLKRNKGDASAAVGEYHGGTNRDNWGPRTDAYVKRVLESHDSIKLDGLATDFAKWMKENPAVVEKPQQTKVEPTKAEDSLATGFGQWLQMQNGTLPDKIPGPNGEQVISKPKQPEAETSLTDKALGALEAGASTVSGVVAGMPAMAVGGAQGILDSIQNGTFGTQQGVQQAEAKAADYANSVTYQPRTATGQQYAANVGEVMANALPLAGVVPELGAITKLAKPATVQAVQVVRQAGADALTVGKQAVQRIPGMGAQSTASASSAGGMGSATPGTMGSAGAAATDAALLRQMQAAELPVPFENESALTKGQATRQFEDVQTERELAKNPEVGAPLRDRYDNQTKTIHRNFEAMLENTEANAPSLRESGLIVDDVLRKEWAEAKTRTRAEYKKANESAEGMVPVPTDAIVKFLNDSSPAEDVAKNLAAAKKELVRLGGAVAADDGTLLPAQLERKNVEFLRQFVNRVTNDADLTQRKMAVELKQVIDDATQQYDGELYKRARKTRQVQALKFENRAVISDILNNKRGMDDRKVAFEDVFKRSILDGSLDDVRFVRRILQTAKAADGRQAWKELQGQTIQWLRDESMKSATNTSKGDTVISADKLNKAITLLDKDGKLDFIFGKKGGEQLRTLNEVAKTILTVPPGSVNTSNTASVLAAALSDMVIASATGVPAPITIGLRTAFKTLKNRTLRNRVQNALNYSKQNP